MATPEPDDQPIDRWESEFREELDQFVFFHLGYDATLRIEREPRGIRVSVEHRRVRPFHFRASRDRVERLLESGEFEDFMLDLLVRHRRHA